MTEFGSPEIPKRIQIGIWTTAAAAADKSSLNASVIKGVLGPKGLNAQLQGYDQRFEGQRSETSLWRMCFCSRFGVLERLRVFSFYCRSYIITSQAAQSSIMFETRGLLSVSHASTISRMNNILQENFFFFFPIKRSSFKPGE